MANTTIKITQLPSIGNGLSASTILPVVNTSGTAITAKVAVGNVANFVLAEAGNTLEPAFLSTLAYSVANSSQPNITSVGNLNINTLHITGGTNGYVLQTNGNGNLSWTAQAGSGNGSPGGANTQLQFNLNGSFAGDADLTWDAGNNKLITANLSVSGNANVGNINTTNINATGNLRPNAIYTDNYFYANGYVFGGGGGNGTPGGTNTQVQFNNNGAFAGEGNFTYDSGNHILNVTRANVSYLTAYTSITGGNSVTANFFIGSGANLTNIAGANVGGFVPNANVANTAFAVAAANVIGLGNIATLSLSGSNSNVLYGNGVFAAVAGGNANTGNVTFNDINVIGTGNLHLQPDSANASDYLDIYLTAGPAGPDIHIAGGSGYGGAVILGTDEEANVAILPGGNVAIQAGNVSGTQTWNFGTDGNVTIPGNIVGAATIAIDNRDSGTTADINIYSADDILIQARNRAIGSTAEGGDINIFAGDSAEDSDTSAGDIVIEAGRGGASNVDYGGAGGFVRIDAGDGGEAIGASFPARPGGDLTLRAGDAGDNNGNIDLGNTGGDITMQAGDSTGNGIPGGSVYIKSGNGDSDSEGGPDGDVVIQTGSNGSTWTFSGDGNLTLPSNSFDVNYANGTPVSIGGGGNTGNVTFDDVTVQGDNSQLELSAGPDFTANLAYVRVRSGDVASHIHMDTGNNEAYDLIVGDDQKFVQVSSTGNIIMSSYDGNTSHIMTLDTNGNLILAGGNSIVRSVANSSLDPLIPNVSTMILTPDAGYSSQSLVLDPTAPGHIHLRAPSANIDEPLANIFLGGETSSFEVGYYTGSAPNVFIHSGGNTWTFDTTGILVFPRDTSNISTDPILNIISGANPTITSTDASLAGPANLGISALNTTFTGFTGDAIKIYPDDGEISSTANLQIWANSGGNTEYSWTFDDSGNLTLPGNTFAVNYANGTQVPVGVTQDITSNGAMSIMLYDGNIKYNNYATVEPSTGNIAGNNISASGNISANNFTGNGGSLSNVATKTTGSWTLAPGVNTVSLSVPINGTYSIWVNGNIPNGIVTYTATAVVTNTNVPVLGTSYGWYYAAGNALVLTSIPTQFVGTVNNISNAVVSTTTANVFTFGITNNSGTSQVVNWGYTKL